MPLDPSISLQIRPTAPSDPIESLTKLAQMRNLLQQGQLRQSQIAEQEQLVRQHQLANAETERTQKDNEEFNKAYLETGGDVPRAIEAARSRGVRAAYLNKQQDELNKQIEQRAKTNRESTQAEDAAINFAHEGLSAVAAEPDQATQAILWDAKQQQAVKAGILTQDQVRPYPGPEGVRLELAKATTLKQITAAAEEKRKADKAAQEALRAPFEQIKAEQEAASATQKATGTEPIQPKDIATMRREEARNAQIAANEAAMRKIQQQNANTNAARLQAETAAVDLTPEAKGKMAEMFAQTGQLPPMGMGKAGARQRAEIINDAAKRFPSVNFATNKAEFQANQTSLKNLQKQQDAIEGFEKTAGKNLDQFLSTAKDVVDSGIPAINAPLRSFSEKVLGSERQQAFNTARQVAVTEIAKVLNNPNGAAALSDSARKEVRELIGPSATLKQVYRAAQILRTDMKNRKDSGEEQIKAIQDRIGGKSGEEKKNDPLGIR